jgi:hypothetical protein
MVTITPRRRLLGQTDLRAFPLCHGGNGLAHASSDFGRLLVFAGAADGQPAPHRSRRGATHAGAIQKAITAYWRAAAAITRTWNSS